MRTCSWVLSLRVTFFLLSGTTDSSREPEGLRVRTFARKLFASTWARTSRCQPTSRAFYSGCCFVDAVMSSCPREKLTHVCGDALCFGQRYKLFRIMAQNNAIQQTTIRFVPSCPVIGFGRPYFVVVVHGAIVESGCVLDVDGGGSCRSQAGRGSSCPTIHADVSGSSLYSLRTHSGPIRLAGKMLSCRHTSCTCLMFVWANWKNTLHIPDHLHRVLFDHKHDFRFLPSILTIVVDAPSMTDVTVEQDICPCPYLVLCLCRFLRPFQRKSELVHSLVPILHSGQDQCPTCRQEEQLRRVQLPRKQRHHQEPRTKKRVVFLIIIVVQNFFTSGVNFHCRLNKRFGIHPCLRFA